MQPPEERMPFNFGGSTAVSKALFPIFHKQSPDQVFRGEAHRGRLWELQLLPDDIR
ncbi:uncharacterized protein J3R85_000226 [Psidium guajava]|nr:uncharacterized protein J3R85_000226 [Psidium guajava]